MLLTEFLQNINEAVKSSEIDKVVKLFSSYLKKRGIVTLNFQLDTVVNGKKCLSIFSVNHATNTYAVTNWELSNTAEISSIHFGNNDLDQLGLWLDGKPMKTISSISPNGSSHTQCLKIIELGLTKGASQGELKKLIEKSRIYEANLENQAIMESLDSYLNGKQKAGESELDFLIRMRGNLAVTANGYKKKDPAKFEETQEMLSELRERIAALRAQVGPGGSIKVELDIPDESELERATPEERFGDMNSYIKSVIKGQKPLALICGAPGVGKTFRVLKEIEKTHRMPQDYVLIKGRCTAPALFMKMWEYRKEEKLLVFDDCDDVFKDDSAINLIKAAYDSSDKRIVSWISSKMIPMETELATQNPDDAVYDPEKGWFYPRIFEYKGSGIIITNYRAGQIDTAIRNRALIADLDFTTKELLDLVRGIMPHIMPGKLSEDAKNKALEYLEELADSGSKMEISIRSFTTCAIQFDCDDNEAAIKRRIKEQMRLQAERGGKKY